MLIPFIIATLAVLILVVVSRLIPYGDYLLVAIVVVVFLILDKIRSVKKQQKYEREGEQFMRRLPTFEALSVKSDQIKIQETTTYVPVIEDAYTSLRMIGKVLDRNRVLKDKKITYSDLTIHSGHGVLKTLSLPVGKKALEFRIALKKELNMYWSPDENIFYLDLSFIDSLDSVHFGYIPMKK